ncbi:MAG: metallophosphoesterase [Bacteroidota bacterium]|nr:metallophosphoesterase [Bacteroidota bacterium]
MRVLHLSDFHLDKGKLEDYTNHIINPLLNSIEKYQKELPFDIIFFTGDLVNLGGSSYENIEEAFKDYEKVFINPLLERTKLTKDFFFFVPGNHDVIRNLDSINIEAGLKQNLNSVEAVNDFFINPEGNNRIKSFKNFENEFYKDTNQLEKDQTDFHSAFKIKIGSKNVGIACLNSSWRCFDSKTDKSNLIIGEFQLNKSLEFIQDCDIKIALSHHHFEWMAPFDYELVSARLKQNFHLYFCGHVHKNSCGYCEDPEGQLFSFCAPGMLSSSIRNQLKKYDNGFTIIDYNIEEAKLKATFKKGEYLKKEFILNTALGNNGIWETKIPIGEAVEKLFREQSLIKQLKDDILPLINSHLITHSTDTKAPKSIDEIFVMPNLAIKSEIDEDKQDDLIEDLKDLIKSEKNYVIFGTKESGKTILLDKIILETVNFNKSLHCLPAYIDFSEIKGNVLSNIRDFWGQSTEVTKSFIEESEILLLIDNISFEEEDIFKLKHIKKFLSENRNVKFIATYQQLFEEDFPLNLEMVSLLDFEIITIKQFKSKQIKLLIQKWFPDADKYETPKKLETLTNAFLALNLPRTPFSVSMFLWIIEKQENYKPINNATLIENFIEKLLSKHSREEAFTERFNYNNKIWLLSEIAFEMLNQDKEDYSLNYIEFATFIDKYIKRKSWDFKSQIIINELLSYSIFVQENGSVRFRFTCFFEFFLVKRMQIENKFKEFVLQEDNYLKFSNELDYFTGLNRGESDILKLIIERLDKNYQELNNLISSKDKTVDELFSPKDKDGNEIKSIVNQLDENKVMNFLPEKPTEEDLEVAEDKKLELQKTDKGISKKENSSKIKDLGKLLILSLKIIKNSEEVDEQNLKLHSYERALKNSISFAILHKAVTELFLRNKDKFSEKKIEEFVTMDKFLPLLHQLLIFEHIGTQKLTGVIREKIKKDQTEPVSEFEKFISVFLYSDIRGPEYDKVVSDFIKNSNKPYIEDMVFFKLITYYYYRAKDEASDTYYLNLIADLVIKAKGYGKEQKSQIIEGYRKKKKEKDIQIN